MQLANDYTHVLVYPTLKTIFKCNEGMERMKVLRYILLLPFNECTFVFNKIALE